jgi:1-phosphatidylinositol-4-phosphate 5-kinase
MNTIYYLGIIDICTPYTTFKRAEHIWKGLHADRVCIHFALSSRISFSDDFLQHKISPVEPGEYSERFVSFLKAVMRDGEGGERFKAD